MRIIGLNHDMFIASAALVEDGRVVAACPEERLTRRHTRAFPIKAIEFCLKTAGIGIEDIDHFAASWNPGAYFKNFNPLLSNRRRWMGEHLYSVPDHLMTLFGEDREIDSVRQQVSLLDRVCDIHYVNHHRAHAGNAYLLSPFDEAAILTADSQGELESTTFAIGRGNKIDLIDTIDYPQSLGAFYSTFTEFLGFRPNSAEWKVMALASFADADNAYYRTMRERVFRLLPDGRFEFDLGYFQGYIPDQPRLFTRKLEDDFGPARTAGDEELEPRHYEIAAALQKATEDIVFHMLTGLAEKTGLKNIAVSGGCFMNSVLNGKILDNTPFDELYISSCPDDSGNALGAAAYLANHVLGEEARITTPHNYWGPSFDDECIATTLAKYKIRSERFDDIESETARLVADGKLVGFFQGAMEFGQRALGNRSILADPRAEEMRDRINFAVKYREGFRPFAPAILSERADDWFDMPPGTKVPFMEKVYPVREDKRGIIPAVTHVDGSGRLQTVEQSTNPRFHGVITKFEELTGVPVVINTSFNLNGEPVVTSPTDAIRTFYSCGLDALVIGNHVARKDWE